MRLISAIQFFTVLAAIGCSQQPPVPSRELINTRTRAWGYQANWPGPPYESVDSSKMNEGLLGHYSATFGDKRRTGVIVYSVFVEVFPEKSLERFAAGEILQEYVRGFVGEKSRKEIEFGIGHLPAIDVMCQRNGGWSRDIVVMKGTRLFHVSVTATNQELFSLPETDSFLKSFIVN